MTPHARIRIKPVLPELLVRERVVHREHAAQLRVVRVVHVALVRDVARDPEFGSSNRMMSPKQLLAWPDGVPASSAPAR